MTTQNPDWSVMPTAMTTTPTDPSEVEAFGEYLAAAGWTRDQLKPWPQWRSPDGQWRVEAHGGDADNGNRRRVGATLGAMYVTAHRRTWSPTEQRWIWPGIVYHHAVSAGRAFSVLRAAGALTAEEETR